MSDEFSESSKISFQPIEPCVSRTPPASTAVAYKDCGNRPSENEDLKPVKVISKNNRVNENDNQASVIIEMDEEIIENNKESVSVQVMDVPSDENGVHGSDVKEESLESVKVNDNVGNSSQIDVEVRDSRDESDKNFCSDNLAFLYSENELKDNVNSTRDSNTRESTDFVNIEFKINTYELEPNTCAISTAELVKRRFRGICTINDYEVEFSLDTMCDITTISEDLAKRVGAQYSDNRTYETTLADGKRAKVRKAKVKIKLGNQASETEVMVLPSLPMECLMGQDMFYSHPELNEVYKLVKETIDKLSQHTNRTGNSQSGSNKYTIMMITSEIQIEDPIIEEIIARIDQTNEIRDGDLETVEKYLKGFAEKVSASQLSELTPTDVITHKIEFTDHTPFRQKCRPIPIAKKAAVEKKLNEMLQGGLIIPSNSPYRSPMHVVNKKDGDVRITIDFRQLNDRTIIDALTVPYIKKVTANGSSR